jgi:PAS domain S-box-containing protein
MQLSLHQIQYTPLPIVVFNVQSFDFIHINNYAQDLLEENRIPENHFVEKLMGVMSNDVNEFQELLMQDVLNKGSYRHEHMLWQAAFEMLLLSFDFSVVELEGHGKVLFCSIHSTTHKDELGKQVIDYKSNFDKIFSNSPLAAELYNSEGIQIKVNQSYEQLWKIQAEDTLMKFNVLESEEVKRQGFMPEVEKAFQGTEVILPDCKFDPQGYTETNGKGRVRWITSRLVPLFKKGEKPGNVLVIHEDITDKKESIAKVEKDARQHRNVLSTAMDAFFIMDREGYISDINDAYVRLSGYSREELIGMHVSNLEGKEELHETKDHIQYIIEKGYDRFESKQIHKDGHIFDVEISCTFQPSDGGRFITFLKDISERKQNEQELIRAIQREQELADVVRNSPTAIAFGYPDGRLGRTNAAFLEMIGYRAEEVDQVSWSDLLTPEKWREKEFEILATLSPDNKRVRYEKEYIHKDGTVFPIELHVSAKFDENGNIDHYIAFIEDITERKIKENELLETQDLLNDTETTAKIGGWIFNLEDMTQKWTPQVFKIYEISEDQMPVRLETIEYYIEEDRQLIKKKAIESIRFGISFDIELRLKAASGKLKWVNVKGRPKIVDGKVISLHGTCQDVTAKKESEEAIEALEASYRGLFDTVSEAIYILDSDGTFLDVNEGALRMYQRPKNYLLGKTPEVVSAEGLNDLVTVAGAIDKAFAGEKQRFEFWGIRRSGKPFLKDVRLYPGTYRGKKVVIAMANDITDVRQKEEELRRAQHIVSNSTDMLGLLDRDYKFLTVNKAMADSFNMNVKDVIGKTSEEILGKEVFESKVKHYLEKCLAGNEVVHHESFDTVLNGNKWFEKRYTPYLGRDGEIVGIVLNSRDITEAKIAEKKLVEASEKAIESDRLKSSFLANMSHEIRTPMNGIMGFAELLKTEGLSYDDHMKYVGIIQKSGKRMLNIINDLIDISKIESGQIEVYQEDVNVHKQLDYIQQFFEPEAKQKGLEIYTHFDPKESLNIVTDKEKLYAIFVNLTKNAIKYSTHGRIDIGYVRKEGMLEFYVKDEGMGMDENTQAIVFKRFIQGDVVVKRAMQGAGLGLAITKAYVEVLGGTIRLESELGVGSVFYFSIPFEDVTTQLSEKSKPWVEKHIRVPKLNILIAEDDESSEHLLRTILTPYASHIQSVDNGVDAVDFVRKNPDIDVVFMDMRMPSMSGMDATKEIRKFNKNIFIVAQTAFGLRGDKDKFLKSGCNAYLSKPVDNEKLMQILMIEFANR